MPVEKMEYQEYVEIAQQIYWVGYADQQMSLHCNPYLIVDGDEAALIDSGGRNDFSTVMLKIMRTGTNPNKINRLIYQHYDPDLCGNIPHIEAIIQNEDLRIISHWENNVFINYYGAKSPKLCIEQMGFHFDFSSGRRLEFIRTPYSHCPGSFMTYDTKTKVLFSSDIFGSYDHNWDLYANVLEECADCEPQSQCPIAGDRCRLMGMLEFHRRVMTSKKALCYALEQIERLDISLIAPQHGGILETRRAQEIAMRKLKSLKSVGIDYFLEGAV